jgi:maleate isomerase
LLPDATHWLATLLPSANRVVEPVTHALLRSQPGIGSLFTRVARRGAVDPFPDRHDIDALVDAARLLADAKPDAMVFSAGKGAVIGLAQDRALAARVLAETGVPLTTPGLALLRALRGFGINQIALAGPHEAAYNRRAAQGFAAEGIDTRAESSLGLTDNLAFAAVGPQEVARLVREAAAAPGVQAVVVWNTNCLAAPLVAGLEAELGMPVLDATMLGVWDGLRLAGVGARPAPEWGRLFAFDAKGSG